MGEGCDCCCNIIWFIFGGFEIGLMWLISGCILCITICGIPMGLQCFKIGCFAMCPFGKDIAPSQDASDCCNCCCNIIWILLCGLYICILEGITGVLFCITICGIPFGLQHFKLARIALTPFGSVITDKNATPVAQPIVMTTPPPVVVVQPGYTPPPPTY